MKDFYIQYAKGAEIDVIADTCDKLEVNARH